MLEISKSHLPQGEALFERHLGIDSISFSWIHVYWVERRGEPLPLFKLSFFLAPTDPRGRVPQFIVRKVQLLCVYVDHILRTNIVH